MTTPHDAPYKLMQQQARNLTGSLLAPTLPERINRLNPSERHELTRLICSMKLRKIIRRTLVEAFWRGEQQKALDEIDSMQRLRTIVRAHESLTSCERALTGSSDALAIEPQLTRSNDYAHLSVQIPGAVTSPAIEHALQQSMKVPR